MYVRRIPRSGASGFLSVVANLITPVYNVVLDYGAVGDGSTNNATALQAACDAVEAAGGGIIYVPKGTFDYGTRLDLPTVSFVLLGCASNATRFRYTGSGTAMRRKDYSTASAWFDVRMQGFTLQNTGTASVGIDGKGLGRSVLEQVRINDFKSSGSGIGLKIDGSYGSSIGAWWNTILACDISDNDTNIKLTGVSGSGQANGNRIRDCRIQEFTVYGINVDVGNSCIIDGNDISSTLSHTAAVRLNDHATSVTNNLFDPATIGVKIDGGNNQYVVGNKGYGVSTMVQVNAGTGHTTSPNSSL